MPDHHKPIEEAGLWDVLDWDRVAVLSAEATSNPRDNVIAAAAKKLIDCSTSHGNEDVEFFHILGKRYISSGQDAERRRQAGDLALIFGADPERLIDYCAYKWGWFKRISPPKPR